jgi:aryl-alcohol dehydrogenase-like predicted oxidoreductase
MDMEYNKLGNTNLTVSKLCFGSLVIGPLQGDFTIEDGANIIVSALNRGVNFIDTAELYETYKHINKAIKKFQKKPIISTKSYAYDTKTAGESLEKARKELDIDVIDIFLLHEQESIHTLRGHREALEFFINQKEKGIIKAVGVSTHNIAVVKAINDMPEIDVVHPIINKTGIGIGDGTIEEMLLQVKRAHELGKGIFGMKSLGGGNLIKNFKEAMDFVLDLPYVDSIAVGMQTEEEVEMNVNMFSQRKYDKNLANKLTSKNRHLHIDYWCEGCGDCINRCKQDALYLENGKAKVKKEKCVLCSYCADVCPVFAIKVF